jgi:hypothetical protein
MPAYLYMLLLLLDRDVDFWLKHHAKGRASPFWTGGCHSISSSFFRWNEFVQEWVSSLYNWGNKYGQNYIAEFLGYPIHNHLPSYLSFDISFTVHPKKTNPRADFSRNQSENQTTYRCFTIQFPISKLHPFRRYMGMDQYLLIPFLGEWTSIYQLFWCSPGVQGFDTLPYRENHDTVTQYIMKFCSIAIGCPIFGLKSLADFFGTPDVIQADNPASERWPWLGATKVFLRFWLPITSGCPYI